MPYCLASAAPQRADSRQDVHGHRALRSRPAPLRAVSRPSARAAERAPRWRGRHLGQAGGLQLGPGLRRQQGAQARVPGRRGPRAGLRHARLDRRRAVEPHPPGRGRRGTARPCLRARAGALGRVARRRLRQGRQHPALADHGRGREARSVRLRHRHPQELGGRARIRRGERRQALRHSRPAPPITRSADSGSRAGPTRWPPRSASSASSSTRSSSAP